MIAYALFRHDLQITAEYISGHSGAYNSDLYRMLLALPLAPHHSQVINGQNSATHQISSLIEYRFFFGIHRADQYVMWPKT